MHREQFYEIYQFDRISNLELFDLTKVTLPLLFRGSFLQYEIII